MLKIQIKKIISVFTIGIFLLAPLTSYALTMKVLVIGGGAGGGSSSVDGGGGGGGGGYQYDATHTITPQLYSVTIGASVSAGTNGNSSVFDTLTALGGTKGNDGSPVGNDAGGPAGTGNTGNGGNGGNGSSNAGSDGTSNSITGSAVKYGGGGGGGNSNGGGASGGNFGGGNGGGGGGGGSNGTANSGGGGGGGGAGSGGNGATGVVIISYVTADWSAFTVTGGTQTTDGANTVRTFNSSGTFTVSASSGSIKIPSIISWSGYW